MAITILVLMWTVIGCAMTPQESAYNRQRYYDNATMMRSGNPCAGNPSPGCDGYQPPAMAPVQPRPYSDMTPYPQQPGSPYPPMSGY